MNRISKSSPVDAMDSKWYTIWGVEGICETTLLPLHYLLCERMYSGLEVIAIQTVRTKLVPRRKQVSSGLPATLTPLQHDFSPCRLVVLECTACLETASWTTLQSPRLGKTRGKFVCLIKWWVSEVRLPWTIKFCYVLFRTLVTYSAASLFNL